MLTDALRKRRSIYQLNKDLPLSQEEVTYLVEDLVELVPDAFNMKSSKVVLAFDDCHDQLWDLIYDAFGGKVAREKIDSFKAGGGTILYFIDQDIVKQMEENFPTYAANFGTWSQQASGMLQMTIWTALAEEGIGANVQHYNPLIDDAVKDLFQVPDNYLLVAQMPFGGIIDRPEDKEKEDISKRVKIFK